MTGSRTTRLAPGGTFDAPDLAPQTPFWAIGDVHGRYDLLAPLLDRLLAGADPIVLLGDYIDRGPDSAAVLRLLQQATRSEQVIALRGNHEELLLQYLVRPRVLHDMFQAYGGRATRESFGVRHDRPVVDPLQISGLRNALRDGLGDLEAWLADLPYLYRSGNIAAMHAGCDPALPLGAQHRPGFCWGHPAFTKMARPDDLWVVHGHISFPRISIKDHRIAIDTAAWQSGTLSAVHIAPGHVKAL